MSVESKFLLHALLMGVFITFLYDILRIFRRVIRHGDFLVSLEDFAFWVFCGGEVFLMMYHESNGTLRWFAVLGAMVGMVLYRKLISPWFVKYASLVIRKILDILLRALTFVFKPAVFVCGKTKSGAGKLKGGIGRLLRRIKKEIKIKLTYFRKILKMNLKAK